MSEIDFDESLIERDTDYSQVAHIDLEEAFQMNLDEAEKKLEFQKEGNSELQLSLLGFIEG